MVTKNTMPFRRLLPVLAAMLIAIGLTGCGHKDESSTGGSQPPHFTKGPGIPPDILAKANAYRAQHSGK